MLGLTHAWGRARADTCMGGLGCARADTCMGVARAETPVGTVAEHQLSPVSEVCFPCTIFELCFVYFHFLF